MYELPKKCDFENITELFSNNQCTPVLKDKKFQGIVINGPGLVNYSGDTIGDSPFGISQINLACLLNLKYDLLGLNGEFVYQVLFVAIDQKTKQLYSGKMENKTMITMDPFEGVPGISPLDFKDVLVTQYFNPNLVEVLGLPAKEADYLVYATIATFKSNVIKLKVQKKQ